MQSPKQPGSESHAPAVETRIDVLRLAYERLIESARCNDRDLFEHALRLEDLASSIPA
jgi:hypothetical protein